MENSNLGNVTNITEYLSDTVTPVIAYTELPTVGRHILFNKNTFGRKEVFNGTKQPEPFLLSLLRQITNNAGQTYYLYGINIDNATMYFHNHPRFGSTVAMRNYTEIYTLFEVKMYLRNYTFPSETLFINPVYYPSAPNYILATETNNWITGTGYSASGVEEDYEI